MDALMEEPWFKDGLRFRCTGCGKCCTGSPGYVYLSPPDLAKLASHFHLSEEAFQEKYTRTVDESLALKDANGSFDCIFLKDNQCAAYDARPVQCRTFPWWIHHLRDPEDWQEAKERCEGIEHPDAPLVSGDHIASECMTYLDNLIEQNFSFDLNR